VAHEDEIVVTAGRDARHDDPAVRLHDDRGGPTPRADRGSYDTALAEARVEGTTGIDAHDGDLAGGIADRAGDHDPPFAVEHRRVRPCALPDVEANPTGSLGTVGPIEPAIGFVTHEREAGGAVESVGGADGDDPVVADRQHRVDDAVISSERRDHPST